MARLPFSNGAREPFVSDPGGEQIWLCDYIQDVLPALIKSTDRQPFTPTRHGASPIIGRSVRNTILLYPGAFNPAHEGHLNLLRHAMLKAGEDLHIIAAIILIADDAQMQDRREREGGAVNPDLHLRQQQRSALWRSEKLQENRVWVYDSTLNSYLEFHDRLLRKARADGIGLDFMLLCGPQELCRQIPVDPSEWGCVGLVTSDLCSPAQFANTDGFPALILPGYTHWSVVNPRETHPDISEAVPDELSIRNTNPAHVSGLDPSIVDMHGVYFVNTGLWHCEPLDNSDTVIRFIQTRPSEHRRQVYSAEDIRRCIAGAPLTSYEPLRRALRGVALNPELLLEYAFRNLKPDEGSIDWVAYRSVVDGLLQAAWDAMEELKAALQMALNEILFSENQVADTDDASDTSTGFVEGTSPNEGVNSSIPLDPILCLYARGISFHAAFAAINEATPISALRSTLLGGGSYWPEPFGTPSPDSIAGDEEKPAEPTASTSQYRATQRGRQHVRRRQVRYPIWTPSGDPCVHTSRVRGYDPNLDIDVYSSGNLDDNE